MFKDASASAEMSSNRDPHCSDEPGLRILRMRAVMRRVGLSRSSIYNMQRCDDFPRPVKLGPRAVGYIEQEIDQWIGNACQRREGSAE